MKVMQLFTFISFFRKIVYVTLQYKPKPSRNMNTLREHKKELAEIVLHLLAIVFHFYLLILFTVALNNSIR